MRIFFMISAIFLLSATTGFSQSGVKTEKATIMTTAICGMCKATIEEAMANLDGVTEARLDVMSRKLKVRYDASKVNLAQIRQAVASVGYDADDVPAIQKAYDALPGCCKKGSSCDMEKG